MLLVQTIQPPTPLESTLLDVAVIAALVAALVIVVFSLRKRRK